MIFGTLVKVIAGFYIGCTGIVTEKLHYSQYQVSLTCRLVNGTNFLDKAIDAKDLEVVEVPKR